MNKEVKNEESLSSRVSAETPPSQELPGLVPRTHVTVGRRSFIRGLGIVGATLLPGTALLMTKGKAQETASRQTYQK